MALLPLVLLAVGLARADDALPSYGEEVVVTAWIEYDRAITRSCAWPRGGQPGLGAPRSCDEEKLRAVIDRMRAFREVVTDDARIHYLEGLAWRHMGDLAAAERAQKQAVTRDADRADAWWELGELREIREDLAGAREAFQHVTRLVPDGPRSFPGWFKLAQIDAGQGDAEALATHLQQALRFGFSFRDVEGQEAWKRFYADPRLHDTLDRLLRVYADEDVRKSLGAEASAQP